MPRKIHRALIGPIRPMTKEDMAATLKGSFVPMVSAGRLRDSHHRIARLAAAGLRQDEICQRTGYSRHRVWELLQSPAMIDLVAKYRSKVDEAFERNQDEFYNLATTNMLKAEREIGDRLDDKGDEIPIKDLISISRDAADRFGYGKKQTNVNINADFAAELEKAIARSGKIIEVVADEGKLKRRIG